MALAGPIFGIAVSDGARAASHIAAFSVTGALMIGMVIYTIYTAKRRSGTHWNKWGPSYFVCIAAIFIMMDPTRHLLDDQGLLGAWASEYKSSGCSSDTVECLSPTGWLITITATYLGYVLLMIGSFWNAQLVSKLKALRDKWRALRGTNKNGDKIISKLNNMETQPMEA